MSLGPSLKLFVLPISLKIKSTLFILSYKEIRNSFPVQPSFHSSHILHLNLSESLSQTYHAVLLLPDFACTVSFSDCYLLNSSSSFKARLKGLLVPTKQTFWCSTCTLKALVQASCLALSCCLKTIYLFHLPECSPPPAVVRLSCHSPRNRIKESGCGQSVSWTLLFLFLQNKPVTIPPGNLRNIENPGDRNWCWTSWCYWIKSSHNKPWSASCLQDKWPNADGSAITSFSNWMSRPLLLENQWLRPSLPSPYLDICSLWSLFKFNGQVLNACHVPTILQGILETWPHLIIVTTLFCGYYHLHLKYYMKPDGSRSGRACLRLPS